MKITVSAFLLPREDGMKKAGVGRHIWHTVDRIANVDLGNEYDIYLPADFAMPAGWQASPWVRWHPIELPSSRFRLTWEHLKIAQEARRNRADVLFATFAAVPFRSRVPVVGVIHDAFPRTHPEGYGPRKRVILDQMHAMTAQRSRRVITVSEWSRDEIARAYRISRDKIDVAYNGPGNALERLEPLALATVDLSEFIGPDERYLFTLSTLEPRKNLPRALQAFAELASLHPDLKLLVAGARGWKESPIFESVERLGLGDRVRFLGYVPDEKVGPLIQRSELFLLPSMVEGFGIPALEAMMVGAPVACANTSSLPEVVGDTAFLFDPLSVDSILSAIANALRDPDGRRKKAEAGYARSAQFSWDRSISAIDASWRRAAGR